MFNISSIVALAGNGLQISEGTNSVGIVRWDLGFCLCAVSCCFFSLIISTLENILKISLIKFASSKKRCIFVSLNN